MMLNVLRLISCSLVVLSWLLLLSVLMGSSPAHASISKQDMEAFQRELPHIQAKGIPLPSEPITLSSGVIQGYTDGDVDIWRGVPFANPPVGDNRFKPPTPVANWTGVLHTWSEKSVCPQIHITNWLFLGEEDCLYANVYAPSNRKDPLPVLVWIYGGGYVFGDGYEFGLYDGSALAANQDMIVVSFNYRLGPLGFMALDQLRAESDTVGNWALLDQQLALKWVKQNIQAFGGDPSRVTIAGESAGAFSVCWHLAAPGSSGLFDAAIMESGTCDSHQFFVSYEDSRAFSETFATLVGCDANQPDTLLPCLRKLETGVIMGSQLGPFPNSSSSAHNDAIKHKFQQLLESKGSYLPQLYPIMPWGPTIDSVALLDIPLNQIRSGVFNRVPVIMGTNEDEGTIFAPMLGFAMPGHISYPIKLSQIPYMLQHFFGNNQTIIDAIQLQYPTYAYPDLDSLVADLLRDFFFVCSSRRALRVMSAQGLPVWLYHFTYKGDWVEDPFLGDYHSAELEYVFGNAWPPLIHIFSQNDQYISSAFQNYWGNLVHFLNPNGNAQQVGKHVRESSQFTPLFWPAFNSSSLQNIVIEAPLAVEDDLFQGQCEFWDQIVKQLYH